jgi:hypothetical protein
MKTRLRKNFLLQVTTLIALFVNFFFSACSIDQSPKLFYIHDLAQMNSTNAQAIQFTVGGTVTGLTGSSLVLQNNGADNITIQGNGSFTFNTALSANATYSVTILTYPSSPTQYCSVTNGNGSIINANITNIAITCSDLSITYTGSPFTFTINSAINAAIPTTTGSITSCSANPALPGGLSISNTTCEITGTPTTNQTATTYTITASNSILTTTSTISITINSNAFSVTFTGSPYTYTQNAPITTNAPILVGTPTSCSANPALPAGLSINNTTCAISGTPTTTQALTNYTITASDSNLSITTSIGIIIDANPPSALTYTGSPYSYTQNSAITTNTPTVTGTVTSCSAAPALPAGLSINATTCAISGTPTGTQAATAYTITASNAFGNTTANVNISVTIAAPSALTYTGSPYSYSQNTAITTNTPTVTGTVTSCSASPVLPTGLSINNTTCAISGTPTVTQATTIHTITATNAGGNTTASISITVTAAPSALTYSSSSYTFKNNTAIATITPTVTGTVTSCSASPVLPTGLSINNTTCAISGTPTTNQASTAYTITASNAGGSTTATFSIVVQTTVYKIFVTASTFNGDLRTAGGGGDGPAGADNLCNADANKPNTSSYKAILFANAIREAKPTLTNWVLQANTVYVRGSDSAPIFTTNASSNFTFGALTNSFDSGAQKQYWTGFRGSGNEWELGLYRCNEWQSSSGVVTGRFGLSDATSYSSISTGAQNNCNTSKYLLCAEQ